MQSRKLSALTFALGMLLACGRAFSAEPHPSSPAATNAVCFTLRETGDIATAIELCKQRIAELNATREEIRQLRISRPSRVNLFVGCVAGVSVIDGRADVTCGGGIGWRLGK